MNIYLLTLFPQMFASIFAESIIEKARERKLAKINLVNIRNFTKDKHKTVDDKPYGGGRGMILKVDVVIEALESIKPKPYTMMLSASGIKYTQKTARFLSEKNSIAIICGHYEGVDARVESFVDEVVSIGDFVLTGGEIAAMAIVDSVVRLIPGVIKKESRDIESFSKIGNNARQGHKVGKLEIGNLLEYPQYTRPEEFRGLKVPQLLLLGNHQKIAKWRYEQAIKRTKKYRPDLLAKLKIKD